MKPHSEQGSKDYQGSAGRGKSVEPPQNLDQGRKKRIMERGKELRSLNKLCYRGEFAAGQLAFSQKKEKKRQKKELTKGSKREKRPTTKLRAETIGKCHPTGQQSQTPGKPR